MAKGRKIVTSQQSVEHAISAAYSDVSDLASEMREWADNLEEKFSGTEKYERVTEAADTLEQCEEPSIDECTQKLLEETLVEVGGYKPDKREAVREVMRYAGPRMLLKHPYLAIMHLLVDGRREKPERAAKKAAPTTNPSRE